MDTAIDVKCPHCGKKMAEKKDGVIEVLNGNQATRIYGAAVVVLECGRCGHSVDMPGKKEGGNDA